MYASLSGNIIAFLIFNFYIIILFRHCVTAADYCRFPKHPNILNILCYLTQVSSFAVCLYYVKMLLALKP